MHSTDMSTTLDWTASFDSAPPSSTSTTLTGDKIILPPSSLEALLSAATQAASSTTFRANYDPSSWDAQSPTELRALHNQLPHPLMFEITNPENGRSIHAGIREFTADEGIVVLSSFLRSALDLDGTTSTVTNDDPSTSTTLSNGKHSPLQITYRALPKGNHVRLRPLEAGYDEDWKALLEDHLQRHYTTLTLDTILAIPAQERKDFRFLIDKLSPQDAICIVDTDLEVDIEPLDESQARESLKRLHDRKISKEGGLIQLEQHVDGEVLSNDYVHFSLSTWDRTKPISIEVDDVPEGDEVDLVVGTNNLHRKPSLYDWNWSNLDSKYPKSITIYPNDEQVGQELYISVHGTTLDAEDDEPQPRSLPFGLYVTQSLETEQNASTPNNNDTASDTEVCSNCKQPIPKRTMFLHQNFCFRNNVLCKHGCGQVFKKGTEHLHWHCDQCSAHGTNSPNPGSQDTLQKHIKFQHTPTSCPSCQQFENSIPELAHHRRTECPQKLILCKFCHLIVPQDSFTDPSMAFMTNLTPHESSCGGRTTNCHICNRIVKLKDLDIHIQNHDIERKSKPLPRICRNPQCFRLASSSTENALDLCNICYGPLYSATYDPQSTALARRVERKYLTQLLSGCQKSWCRNPLCKTGRHNTHLSPLSSKEAMEMIKPLTQVDALLAGYTGDAINLCVDETTDRRRRLAERLSMEADEQGKGGWSIEWCVKAVNETIGDEEKARVWLQNFAVRRDE